jgi:hypothetical protein
MSAEVLNQGWHRAGLQMSRIVDAVQEFADETRGETGFQQQPDVPDLVDRGIFEESLPGRGSFRRDKALVLVVANKSWTHAGAGGKFTDSEELPVPGACL